MLNHNISWSGGTFFRAYYMAKHLTRLRHKVTLLSISPNKRVGLRASRAEGVEVIETPDLFWGRGRTGWDPWDIINRIAYVDRRHYDIIHAWDCRPAVIFPALYARWSHKTNKPSLIIDWCDWWGRGGTQKERPGGVTKVLYNPVETYFEEAFRAKADGTTVISKALYERALKLGVSSEFMKILPQGCDVEIEVDPDRNNARRILGIALEELLIVGVGALMPADAFLLFDALSLVFQKVPTCKMVLIGKHGISVPDNIKKKSNFHETGFISEGTLRNYMTACDILIVPLADNVANKARWPSKANPFVALGRAVVITRVGDLPDLLEREDAALVVDPKPKELADGIVRLSSDRELIKHYENNARMVARNILAWPLIVAQLEELYFNVRGKGFQGCSE